MIDRSDFPAFAAANGFDPKKVKFIEMPYGALIPSLLAHRIAIITLFATELPTIRPKAAKMGKEVGEEFASSDFEEMVDEMEQSSSSGEDGDGNSDEL